MQGYSIFEGNYSEIENENKNIIFLDYINGWDNIDSVLNTIIHELQHIIHYSNLRESKKTDFDVCCRVFFERTMQRNLKRTSNIGERNGFRLGICNVDGCGNGIIWIGRNYC